MSKAGQSGLSLATLVFTFFLTTSTAQEAIAWGEEDAKVGVGWELQCSDLLAGNNETSAECSAVIHLGSIDRTAEKTVRSALERIRKITDIKIRSISIELNSRGGDLDAALAIARDLRKEKVTAVVDGGAICASSCVFVLAGAPRRLISGKVRIHRPFIEPKRPISVSNLTDIRRHMVDELYAFADEMNVQRRLVDEMQVIPSDSSKTLRTDELISLGFSPVDPVFSEAENQVEAANLKITVQELLQRRALARIRCASELSADPYIVDHQMKSSLCARRIINN